MELLLSSLGATFILGLSFGAGACMFTCIPTLGVVLMSQQLTPRETLLQTWRFNLGRITAYALLGAISAAVGASIASLLEAAPVDLIFAALLFGSAVVLWRSGSKSACASHHNRNIRGGLFGMGFGMGLRPCAPLTGVLVASAATGSWAYGLLLGLSFGLGAVVIPQLVFGYALGRAGAEIRSQLRSRQQTLARSGAAILALVGMGVGFGVVSL